MSRPRVTPHGNQAQSNPSEVLSRALRVFRQEGVRAAVRRTTQALKSIQSARRCAHCVRRLPENMTIQELTQFVYDQPIRPWQVRSEISELASMVEECRPRTVLEIGTARGGTLFLWARLAHPEATLISIDLPGGEFGGGYPVWLSSLYRSFALPGQTIHLLRGDSHNIENSQQVRELLSGRGIEFLFIDGDHTYDGVKRDFETYSALLRKGGMVALHDIAQPRGPVTCEVWRFWNEIRTGHHHREFIADGAQGWAGIGVFSM